MTLLQEAARGTSVWLTSQVVDNAELTRRVHAALRLRDPESVRVVSMPGETLRGIMETEAPDHVAGWIGAGHIHEELLALSPAPDYVFCLDPWAAMVFSRSRALLPRAKWAYLVDAAKLGRDREYWGETDAWLGQLGFDEVLPVEALGKPAPEKTGARSLPKRPGAWEWRSLCSVSKTVAVSFSGSILRLRVFVEGFLRLNAPPPLFIVAKDPSAELIAFISLVRVARPALKVELVPVAPAEALAVEDGVIVPPDFFRRSGARRTLNPEIAAHILVGDLDPVPVYADLLLAHQGAPEDLLVLP